MTFLTKKRHLTKKTKGFTLIELLVVIAIIGVLASIVLASLNTARKKSRDTRRVADMNQARLALQLFYDSNRGYPNTAAVGAGNPNGGGTAALVPTFIASWPGDPLAAAGTGYTYFGAVSSAAGGACPASVNPDCQFFHTGAAVEDPAIAAMGSDSDRCTDLVTATCAAAYSAATVTALPGTTIHGTDGNVTAANGSDCTATPAAGRGCYDVTP